MTFFNKIYTVIAHLSNGDVLITPNRKWHDQHGGLKYYPGFFSKEEAKKVVSMHNIPGVSFEIVPRWTEEAGEEIIERAENGRWCPMTVEKLTYAIRHRIDSIKDDYAYFPSFLCKDKLCDIHIDDDEDGTIQLHVEDLEGNVKEADLETTMRDYIHCDFAPYVHSWELARDCAEGFFELLKSF